MIIAFLGTGLMGLPMVINLLKSGFQVNAYNRTLSKTVSLTQANVKIFSKPIQAIANADIIITMLDSESAQEQVLFNNEALTQCKKECLIIDMASTSPTSATKHASMANQHQLSYLDAPVSGGTLGATNAELVVMVGGEKSDVQKAMPVFNALAKKTVHIGPVGTGQITKCANQAIVGITIGAVSEALLLASKGGADINAVREALLGGFAQSKVLDQHGQRMIDHNFIPGGTAKVQLKDFHNIMDYAHSQALTLPFTQTATAQYTELVSSGRENLDLSALLLLLEQNNNTTL